LFDGPNKFVFAASFVVLFNAFAQCSNTVLTIAVFAPLLGTLFEKKLAVQLEKYFPKSLSINFPTLF
jgi:hypothetical protein